MEKNNSRFSLFANKVVILSGKPLAFSLALCSVALWAAIGLPMHFDGEWKEWAALYMSSITFLLVFTIQHSQNRDTTALHLKLDELIRATHGAHTSMLKAEDLSDREMQRLGDSYKALADDARDRLSEGRTDTHTPDMDLSAKEMGEE